MYRQSRNRCKSNPNRANHRTRRFTLQITRIPRNPTTSARKNQVRRPRCNTTHPAREHVAGRVIKSTPGQVFQYFSKIPDDVGWPPRTCQRQLALHRTGTAKCLPCALCFVLHWIKINGLWTWVKQLYANWEGHRGCPNRMGRPNRDCVLEVSVLPVMCLLSKAQCNNRKNRLPILSYGKIHRLHWWCYGLFNTLP